MKFTTRPRGIYQIITPQLRPKEIFDSGLLKETVLGMLNQGPANFCLDLSPLEYIYSDTLNVLVSTNKSVLNRGGRLALMGPNPEVVNTLERTGIHNILRIYRDQEELEEESRDIINNLSPISKNPGRPKRGSGDGKNPFQKICRDIEKAVSKKEFHQSRPKS
jgi:anti-anti-sigma factor